MSSDLHDSTHDPLPSNPPQPAVAATPADGSKGLPMAGNVLRLRLLLFLAGLLAGACAAGLGEQLHNYFSPELKLVELQGNKMMQPVPETRIAANLKNGALDNAELGALFCLALGVAGGLARRSARAAVVAGLLGLALGTTIGAVASWVLYPLFYAAKHYTASTEPDLLVSLGIHSGMWALLGAAGGLAFAIGLGDRGRIGPAVIGGFLGACVATLIYEVTGAVFFPCREPASPSPRPGGPACWSGFSCRCSLLWQSASSSSCRSSQRSEPPFAHGPDVPAGGGSGYGARGETASSPDLLACRRIDRGLDVDSALGQSRLEPAIPVDRPSERGRGCLPPGRGSGRLTASAPGSRSRTTMPTPYGCWRAHPFGWATRQGLNRFTRVWATMRWREKTSTSWAWGSSVAGT